ncbi:hypothetical protein Tco_0115879 [Tanacetum coccineum]
MVNRLTTIISIIFLIFISMISECASYRPGDIVPMSKMGQYHSSRTVWHDMIGRHCPIFGVNREVLVPISKPTGFTGADPYKISFQVGKEKYYIPWLLVVNRKSSEVPMIDVHLRYSGNDLLGVTAKVVDMPHHYVELHPDIGKQFWDSQIWPKHVLVRYTWEEQSEIDVTSGFYVLFGSGLLMSFFPASSVNSLHHGMVNFSFKGKWVGGWAGFVRDTVAESSSMPGGVAKVE